MKKNVLLFILIVCFLEMHAQFTSFDSVSSCCEITCKQFNGNNSNTIGQSGPDYGCLNEVRRPLWFYIPIRQSGNIELYIYQNNYPKQDLDFACWGPFSQMPAIDSLTAGLLTPSHHLTGASPFYPSGNMIDCSFDQSDYMEWCYIPNAVSGQYYILLVSQYTSGPCVFGIGQSYLDSVAGRAGCNLLPVNVTSNSPVCQGDTLKFEVNPTNADTYIWEGPHGMRYQQNANSILLLPNSEDFYGSGIFAVSYFKDCQISDTAYITTHVTNQIQSVFTYDVDNQNVNFNNFSSNSDSSFWDFGDGNTSSLTNPSHLYQSLGTYNVSLISFNSCGYDTYSSQILITSLGVIDVEKLSIVISPNPAKDIFIAEIPENIKVNTYEVIGIEGKVIKKTGINSLEVKNKITIDLSGFPESVYFLKIYTTSKIFIYKLIKI